MGPKGSGKFKVLLLLEVAAKSLQTCPKFSSQWFSQKNRLGTFEIFSLRDQKFQIHHRAIWGNQNLNYLENESDRRAKRSEIWDSRVVVQFNILGYL